MCPINLCDPRTERNCTRGALLSAPDSRQDNISRASRRKTASHVNELFLKTTTELCPVICRNLQLTWMVSKNYRNNEPRTRYSIDYTVNWTTQTRSSATAEKQRVSYACLSRLANFTEHGSCCTTKLIYKQSYRHYQLRKRPTYVADEAF